MNLRYIKYLAFVLPLILLACSGNHQEKGEEHKHDATLSFTAYTQDYEVYLVADPFVAGKEGHLILHLTGLNGFKPVADAQVKVEMKTGAEAVALKPTGAHAPGEYEYAVTPAKAGAGSLIITLGAERVEFAPITVYADEHEAYEAAEAKAPKHPDGIAFGKDKSRTIDFATEPVELHPMGGNVKAMALVEPSAAGERTLCATTPGRVTLLDNRLAVGQPVSAGKPMFRVDASGIAEGDLQLRIKEAQAEYDRARRDYDRAKDLMKNRLATAAELSRAEADFQSAAATLASLRKNFSGGKQTVSSPISGFVSAVNVTDGQWVEIGSPLATVASSRNVQLTAKVSARYSADLSSLKEAVIVRSADTPPVNISSLGGRFISKGTLVEPGSPMIPVVMEINNELNLLPGSYVDVILRFGTGTQALAIPRSAVVEEMGNTFVMVQITPEYFEKRRVQLGSYDGAYYQVLSGLKQGERIVTKGAPIVKLSQGAGAVDPHSGHAH